MGPAGPKVQRSGLPDAGRCPEEHHHRHHHQRESAGGDGAGCPHRHRPRVRLPEGQGRHRPGTGCGPAGRSPRGGGQRGLHPHRCESGLERQAGRSHPEPDAGQGAGHRVRGAARPGGRPGGDAVRHPPRRCPGAGRRERVQPGGCPEDHADRRGRPREHQADEMRRHHQRAADRGGGRGVRRRVHDRLYAGSKDLGQRCRGAGLRQKDHHPDRPRRPGAVQRRPHPRRCRL